MDWISGLGSLQIDGTLLTSVITSQNYAATATIIVNGIFEMQGTLSSLPIPVTINNGGYVHLGSLGHLDFRTITINPGDTFVNDGIIGSNGTFIYRFPNAGTVAPGNSPGVITVEGDYIPSTSAVHNFEVGGMSSNQYDRLVVNGTANISGTLNVSLINGFTPTTDHDLPIITGTINGTFSTVNIPSQYSLVYTANSVILRRQTSGEFIGTMATDWEVPANWSTGNVPDATSAVIIKTASVIINSNVAVKSLTIIPGATCTVNSGYTLTILQ